VLQIKHTLRFRDEKINICKQWLKWGDCSLWFSLRIFKSSILLLFLNLPIKNSHLDQQEGTLGGAIIQFFECEGKRVLQRLHVFTPYYLSNWLQSS
jgi:hypothetical protein